MSSGTNDSAAVVTAAIRSIRSAGSARLLGRPPALVEQPDDVGRVGREGRPAGGRPHAAARRARAAASRPRRASAVTAAEIDGWVTTSSSAAAVTEPVLTTARKLRSWVSVIATRRKA